ncbi:MAG: tryptophan--tRNA ligase [Candidatus Sericytochromatia bacterium]|nr:tryptophan--tRNA ligase [Candidatus Sericytochromatia bacterium]
MAKIRIMSGMRPTGTLHLGHLVGVLRNWVALQDAYDCYFSIVDWHALTTGAADTAALRGNVREVLLDWLAAGVDPDRCTIYVQSAVPEIAELALLFGMITPLTWLQRNPTIKEQIHDLGLDEERVGYGLMGYPILQAADILAFKGARVPVGKDQLPHLELSRDIARRFNHMYGETFPEPEGLLSETPLIVGTDGRKMSKSYGNDLRMASPAAEVAQRVMGMVTDPGRQRRDDPGYPEVCTVHAYWRALAPDRCAEVEAGCRAGALGCVADKKAMAALVEEMLAPMRARREAWAADPVRLDTILAEGNARARAEARRTLAEVRARMQLPVFDDEGRPVEAPAGAR